MAAAEEKRTVMRFFFCQVILACLFFTSLAAGSAARLFFTQAFRAEICGDPWQERQPKSNMRIKSITGLCACMISSPVITAMALSKLSCSWTRLIRMMPESPGSAGARLSRTSCEASRKFFIPATRFSFFYWATAPATRRKPSLLSPDRISPARTSQQF